jgi:uncharacterized membrane protein YjfL (UPF0719 family)
VFANLTLEMFGIDCGVIFVFALIAGLVMFLVYKAGDLLFLRKVCLEEQIAKGNIAAAIFSSAIVLGIAIVIGNVISGVLR